MLSLVQMWLLCVSFRLLESCDVSTDLTSLMCFSYESEIYFGETWTATMAPISGNQQYVEAAYNLVLAAAPGASANTIAAAQWANWELFDSNDPNLLANLPWRSGNTAATAIRLPAGRMKVNTDGPEMAIPKTGSQQVA